jgi:hypothetical protein
MAEKPFIESVFNRSPLGFRLPIRACISLLSVRVEVVARQCLNTRFERVFNWLDMLV